MNEKDYAKWASKDTWSIEEAAALLLNLDPKENTIKKLGLEELRLLEGPVGISLAFNWRPNPDQAEYKQFASTIAWILDAITAGTLSANNLLVIPSDLIFWAKTRNLIGLPTRSLVSAVGVHHLYDKIDRATEDADR